MKKNLIAAFLLLTAGAARAQESATVTLPAQDADRRWVVARVPSKLGSAIVTDAKGVELPAQADGAELLWLIPFVPAKEKASFSIRKGESTLPSMVLKDDGAGELWVGVGDREITRYHVGASAEKHKKPYFYPLMGQGVNVLRGWPMDPKPGDATDHPHHTGHYFAFGEVNGKEYWSKLPITPKKLVLKQAGPAAVRIVAENAWGDDLLEKQDVLILNAGADTILDWTITLTAPGPGPSVLARDLKMAKEGAFVLRLVPALSQAKGDAPEMISDSKGGKGEKAARAAAAPWVDYSGEVAGKKVGVAMMNHPSSFRYPADWHVRAYGLFAANPWIVKGENTLQKGESLTLKYRVYLHAGDAAAGKVADVFAGYANAQLE